MGVVLLGGGITQVVQVTGFGYEHSTLRASLGLKGSELPALEVCK